MVQIHDINCKFIILLSQLNLIANRVYIHNGTKSRLFNLLKANIKRIQVNKRHLFDRSRVLLYGGNEDKNFEYIFDEKNNSDAHG
jgi:hypothetical protein